MKVYISGPMTGKPDFNRPAFVEAARELRARGLEVISPVEVNPPDAVERPWAYYLRRAIRALMDADAIVTLPGSLTSRGSLLETFIGSGLGMPIHELSAVLSALELRAADPVEVREMVGAGFGR